MLYRTSLSTPVFGLRREIDRLFEDAFGGGGDARGSNWSPAVDVREDERELTFSVELPGIRPEDVEVTAENGVVTIRGEKQQSRKEGDETGRYHLIERSYGSFMRAFQLPQNVTEDKIEADFNHGVLTVRVPKAELPQPRKIQIKGAVNEQQGATRSVGAGQETSNRQGSTGSQRGEKSSSGERQNAKA